MYTFTPFALIGRVLQKVNQDQCRMLITTPAWLSQPWFLGLLKIFVKNSLLLPVLKDLLRDPAGMLNLPVMQNSLQLLAWTVSRVSLEELMWLVFWTGGISTRSNINNVLDFLAALFEKGLEYRVVGTYRSVLSAFHNPTGNFQVNNHPRVSTLMSGILNKRTPQPNINLFGM